MLNARKIDSRGFGKECCFEVSVAGTVVGIVNDTKLTFEVDNRSFSIASSKVVGRQYELKAGDTVVASAKQKPLFNYYNVDFAGKQWTFKATNLLATEFGFFENETQTGTLSAGSFFNRLKDIKADLPDHVPREIQMFLLCLFISKLTEPS